MTRITPAAADAISDAFGAEMEREIERLRTALNAALDAGARAIGDHFPPDDCYATGPLTGSVLRDLVECPACSFAALRARLKEPKR